MSVTPKRRGLHGHPVRGAPQRYAYPDVATLLGEIIDGTSGTSSVPTLLRKLKVLAARTGSHKLAEWVTHELDGYPNADEVPVYRGPMETIVLGCVVGFAGNQAKNVPIPPSVA
jgi:hypothetical protein